MLTLVIPAEGFILGKLLDFVTNTWEDFSSNGKCIRWKKTWSIILKPVMTPHYYQRQLCVVMIVPLSLNSPPKNSEVVIFAKCKTACDFRRQLNGSSLALGLSQNYTLTSDTVPIFQRWLSISKLMSIWYQHPAVDAYFHYLFGSVEC